MLRGFRNRIIRYWDADKNSGTAPTYPLIGSKKTEPDMIRVTLRAPPWTAAGYSQESPGFVFWYRPFLPAGPAMFHGEGEQR